MSSTASAPRLLFAVALTAALAGVYIAFG